MALLDQEQTTVAPDGRPTDQQPQWRQDFPIDWPQDHYVARRDFTKFMVLTSLAFTVGQFWIALKNLVRKQRGELPIVKLAAIDQLQVGQTLVFAYPEEYDKCLLTCTAPNTFVAYSQSCTHLSCAVIPEVEKGRLHCPCHMGFFDLKSGIPIAGPPRRPLPRITLEIRQGVIYATGIAS